MYVTDSYGMCGCGIFVLVHLFMSSVYIRYVNLRTFHFEKQTKIVHKY